jgi:cytochrome c biogenesis protein CcmG/thiol:disulfide interchange protein DsbE
MAQNNGDRRLYLMIGALLLVSAVFGMFVMPRLSPAGGRLLNKPAPDFTLPVVVGGAPGARQRLSDLRGKIVILDFWATWCPPCDIQAPILDRVARNHPEDVVVLGINVGEPPEVMKRHVVQKGLSYPMLADLEGEVQGLYGAGTLPTLVIVDRDGKVVHFVQSVVREETLERAIRGS